jgi:hypothetical protein
MDDWRPPIIHLRLLDEVDVGPTVGLTLDSAALWAELDALE